MREDGLEQAEALIRHHFGLAPEEIRVLDDETFCDLAAHAYFYEDRKVVAVKRGVMLAIAEMFGK